MGPVFSLSRFHPLLLLLLLLCIPHHVPATSWIPHLQVVSEIFGTGSSQAAAAAAEAAAAAAAGSRQLPRRRLQSDIVISNAYNFDLGAYNSVKVSDGFMGFSMSYNELPRYINDTVFQQLAANLLAYRGSGTNALTFRAMGIPTPFPKDIWPRVADGSKRVPSRFILQIPLSMTNQANSNFSYDNYQGLPMIRDAVKYLGADSIVSFSLGNEPDWFVANRGWDKVAYFQRHGDYDRDVQRVEDATSSLLKGYFGTCQMLAASETANWWTSILSTSRQMSLLADHPCIKTVSTHHYTGAASDSSYTYKNLLSNEILYGALATANTLVPIAISGLSEYRVTEISSLFGGGRWGLSDRFGVALWGLEVSMGLAFSGTAGLNFNGGGCSANAPILRGVCEDQLHYDPLSPGIRPNALYYGMLMFQMAVGSGARITSIPLSPGGIQTASAWGFISTASDSLDRRRIVIINRDQDKSGYVTITLAGFYRPGATTCELTAQTTLTPRENATAGHVSLCGQSVNAGGILTPQAPVLQMVDGVVSYVPYKGNNLGRPFTSFTFWINKVTAKVLQVRLTAGQ